MFFFLVAFFERGGDVSCAEMSESDGSTLSVKLTSAQPVNKDFMALCQDAVILLKPDSDCVCHIINPTSQPILISANLHIAHMTLFEPHTIDAAYRCTDTTVNGEEQFDEIHEIDEMLEDDGNVQDLNALDYRPPKQDRFLPYQCLKVDGKRVEVVTQTEPDIHAQTARSKLKPLDWNEHIPVGSMDDEVRSKLIDLLDFHRPAFSKDMTEIGVVPDFYHRIELKHDARVVRQRPYRTSPENEAEIEAQIKTLLDNGIVTYSDSMWSSPVILVEKKPDKPGGKTTKRMCVDLRMVNRHTFGYFTTWFIRFLLHKNHRRTPHTI